MLKAAGLVLSLLAVSCSSSPESRAIAFLAVEVPEWPVKNKCFSCHNNGDAARALVAARRHGIPFDPAALETTARWLRRPERWKDNGPPGEFSDKDLAALQFAHALAALDDPGPALDRAAAMLADLQRPDGSWKVDAEGLPGSPVTYGRVLATVVARKVLARTDAHRFREPLERADRWLLQRKPGAILEAAALLLHSEGRREDCLELLRKGQGRDGGWGPYVTSPPEVFETAVSLLGLSACRASTGVPEMIRRGREFLVSAQQSDGGWPETMRPPGANSYAQRISTTGWAAIALLTTR